MLRERVLIVAPYGIGLRDFLLNEELGDYLRGRFDIDVLSPFEFDDPASWGITNTYPLIARNLLDRVLSAVNHRALFARKMIAYKGFYEFAGWSKIYQLQLWAHTIVPDRHPDYDRWSARRHGLFGRIISAAAAFVPLMYPSARLLAKNRYRAVFVIHPTEGECTVMAAAARRRHVPVICLSMGVDNLMSMGPVMMTPDLLLLWGPEQMESFQLKHASFRPELRFTKAVITGGLSHDRISWGRGTEAFDRRYPQISPTSVVVTYTTNQEVWYPRQTETCETILAAFSKYAVDGHLIVRVRRAPGDEDEHIWRRFEREHPGLVTMQIPSGVSYTKSGAGVVESRVAEEGETELYAATLRRSSLVISGGFSTVYLDAFAARTPAIVGAIPPRGTSDAYAIESCRAYREAIPAIRDLDIVTTHTDLKDLVGSALGGHVRDKLIARSQDVYSKLAGTADGKAGARAAAAIEELLNTASSGRGNEA